MSEDEETLPNSTKVVFLGDSITQQGENSEGEGTYKGFITSLRENVSQEVELINKGIGGNKVSDLLLRYNDDVLKLKLTCSRLMKQLIN